MCLNGFKIDDYCLLWLSVVLYIFLTLPLLTDSFDVYKSTRCRTIKYKCKHTILSPTTTTLRSVELVERRFTGACCKSSIVVLFGTSEVEETSESLDHTKIRRKGISKKIRKAKLVATVAELLDEKNQTNLSTKTINAKTYQIQQQSRFRRQNYQTMNENNFHQKPLYITIGPPCCGKTTWGTEQLKKVVQSKQELKTQSSRNHVGIQDITLDDQDGVYVPLPLFGYFVSNCSLESDAKDEHDVQKFPCMDTVMYGQTIQERLDSFDQRELRIVLERLTNYIDKNRFKQKLKEIQPSQPLTSINCQHDLSSTDQSEELTLQNRFLLEVVEGIMKQSNEEERLVQIPTTVDLFVREAVFRPSQHHQQTTGIDRATHALYNVPVDTAVIWGNTNTKPTDYKSALTMACQQKRPVFFMVYCDTDEDNNDISSVLNCVDDNVFGFGSVTGSLNKSELNGTKESIFEDTKLEQYSSYKELVRRNIRRLQTTGRYVPVTVIWDMRKRCMDLVRQVIQEWQKTQHLVWSANNLGHKMNLTKFEMDRILAGLVNFQLRNDRVVVAESNMYVEQRHNKRQYNTDDDRSSNEHNKRQHFSRRPWDSSSNQNRISNWQHHEQRESGVANNTYKNFRHVQPSPDNDRFQPIGQGNNSMYTRDGRGGRGQYNDRNGRGQHSNHTSSNRRQPF
jgi:hypothetical protein